MGQAAAKNAANTTVGEVCGGVKLDFLLLKCIEKLCCHNQHSFFILERKEIGVMGRPPYLCAHVCFDLLLLLRKGRAV